MHCVYGFMAFFSVQPRTSSSSPKVSSRSSTGTESANKSDGGSAAPYNEQVRRYFCHCIAHTRSKGTPLQTDHLPTGRNHLVHQNRPHRPHLADRRLAPKTTTLLPRLCHSGCDNLRTSSIEIDHSHALLPGNSKRNFSTRAISLRLWPSLTKHIVSTC